MMAFEVIERDAFIDPDDVTPGLPPPTQPPAEPPGNGTPPNNPGQVPGRAEPYKRKFPGFYVFAGRIDSHYLSPCVEQDVLHTHVTIKRYENTPDSEAWFHFHVGLYRDGANRCYVLYDSKHKWICLKVCISDQSPLEAVQEIMSQALSQGFEAEGIQARPWVIAAAALILAVVLVPVL